MIDPRDNPTMVAYIVVISIAIMSNGIVLALLMSRLHRISNSYLSFIVLFHVAIMGDLITALPYVFNVARDWCIFNQAMKYYFTLMQLFVLAIIVQGNRLLLTTDSKRGVITHTKRQVAYFIALVLPCISFLPYSDSYFDFDSSNPFCTGSDDYREVWIIFLQHFWVAVVLTSNTVANVSVWGFLLSKGSPVVLRRKFLLRVFAYAFICLLSWIPRFLALFLFGGSNDDGDDSVLLYDYYRYFPIVLASFAYSGLFFANRREFLAMERVKSTTSSINDTLHVSATDLLSIVEEGDQLSFYRNLMSFVRHSFASSRESTARLAKGTTVTTVASESLPSVPHVASSDSPSLSSLDDAIVESDQAHSPPAGKFRGFFTFRWFGGRQEAKTRVVSANLGIVMKELQDKSSSPLHRPGMDVLP